MIALRPLLPWLPWLVGVAAIAATLWAIDQRGYRRARAETAAQAARTEAAVRTDLRRSEQRLAERVSAIDRAYGAQSTAASSIHRALIQPVVVKELARDTRYYDPALGISDSLRGEINRALGLVACTAAADGGIVCTLSHTRTAAEQ